LFSAPLQTSDRLANSFPLDHQERVNTLSGQIENLCGKKQVGSIKFAGLGFDLDQKASAWLTMNIATVDAGLIVDPHTAFDERVHKLQILTLQQGYAMASFQQVVPKFFATSGTRVVRDHASFFNKINTWAEWDHQHTSFRDVLKSGLAVLQRHTKRQFTLLLARTLHPTHTLSLFCL
jgi:hypothetical protein